MNIFRLCGDMSHVFSIIVLLLRLRVAKNASGELRRRIRRRFLWLRLGVCVCLCAFILEQTADLRTGPQHHTVEMRYAFLTVGELSMLVLFLAAEAGESHAYYRHER